MRRVIHVFDIQLSRDTSDLTFPIFLPLDYLHLGAMKLCILTFERFFEKILELISNIASKKAFFCSVDVMKARLGEDIVRCIGYGHIGDGNMHLNITSKEYNQEVMDKIEPFLYEWTSQQNGSISAEHGMYFSIKSVQK